MPYYYPEELKGTLEPGNKVLISSTYPFPHMVGKIVEIIRKDEEYFVCRLISVGD